MKTILCVLALGLATIGAAGQTVTKIARSSGVKTVKLVGLLNFDGEGVILEIGESNYNCPSIPYQKIFDEKETYGGIELQSIDLDKRIVVAKVDGELRAIAFEGNDATNTGVATPTIQLHGARIQPLTLLYANAKGRTVLEHPKINEATFTLTANPKTKAEIAKTFEKLFASQEITAIP